MAECFFVYCTYYFREQGFYIYYPDGSSYHYHYAILAGNVGTVFGIFSISHPYPKESVKQVIKKNDLIKSFFFYYLLFVFRMFVVYPPITQATIKEEIAVRVICHYNVQKLKVLLPFSPLQKLRI